MEHLNSENGFTLIEILIALTIFAVGLLSVAGMQVTSINGNMKANVLSTETALANGVLEEVLMSPVFGSSTTSAVDWDFDKSDAAITPISLQGSGEYNATYEVDLDYNGAGIALVSVTVQGAGAGNSNNQVTVVGFKGME